MNLNQLRDEIHENAINHGWWDEPRSFGEIVALCHSELSEALEEYRNINSTEVSRKTGNILYYSGGGYVSTEPCERSKKPEGIAIELADTIIRILDYCGQAGIDIEEAIRIKNEYNLTRPYRHGGKKI